ncbi:MAG: response regulator [Ignavibacteriales bacterium]|nr:response regulator [Ignavibacteriales bacterium]
MAQKILIAEDDKNVQALVVFKLKNSGFDVVAVNNGIEAIEYLKHSTVDLVMLDMMMPLMSGKEALLVIKSEPKTKSIPVVFLTARTLEKEVVEILSLGADDYIKKPFSPSELVARVRAVLIRSQR